MLHHKIYGNGIIIMNNFLQLLMILYAALLGVVSSVSVSGASYRTHLLEELQAHETISPFFC